MQQSASDQSYHGCFCQPISENTFFCGCQGVTDQSLDLCDCAVDQLYSDCHQSVVTTILCDCGVLAHLFDPGLSDIPNGVEVKSTWLEVKCPQNHNV